MKSIDNINNLNKSDFLTIFGNVFEKTDWIAEKVFGLKPFKDFEDFSSKIFDLYDSSQYKNKFGFPFIIAVKGKNKNEILNNFRQRILNDIESEFEEAKNQVKKIATFRLNEIINQ